MLRQPQSNTILTIALILLAASMHVRGLARAAGAFAYTNGTASYTEQVTFTASATFTNMCESGLSSPSRPWAK